MMSTTEEKMKSSVWKSYDTTVRLQHSLPHESYGLCSLKRKVYHHLRNGRHVFYFFFFFCILLFFFLHQVRPVFWNQCPSSMPSIKKKYSKIVICLTVKEFM